jgi:outer membrane receptor protein involved in Fe transport
LKDQWQVSRRLTMSYGVRWDRFPMGARDDRGMERYDFDTNTMRICGLGNVPKDCGYEVPWTYFSPRIGLAWRATELSSSAPDSASTTTLTRSRSSAT